MATSHPSPAEGRSSSDDVENISQALASHLATISIPQELIVCSICEELYDKTTRKAKFLECHHTFCSHCLTILSHNKTYIPCPNCRSNTALPEKGVAGLQTNFYVDSMQGISAKSEQPNVTTNTEVCHNHGNQQMFFFCETCKMSICRDCTVLDHKETAGHNIINISAAKVAHRHKLKDQQNIAQITRTKTQMTVQQIESEVAKQQAERASVITSVEHFRQCVHQQLEQWQKDATDAILNHHDTWHKPLLEKKGQLHDTVKLLDKLISQSEDALKTGEINGLVHVTEKLKTTNESKQSDFKNQEKLSLASDLITRSNPLHDKLLHLWERCFASFQPIKFDIKHKEIVAGLKSEITVEMRNYEDNVVPLAPWFLTIELNGPDYNSLPVALNNITHSGCSIVVTPEESGTLMMSIMYNSYPLGTNDPEIFVSSNNPVLKFAGNGNGNGCLDNPTLVAIDNSNCLYVADNGNSLIQKFSVDGEFLSQIYVNPNGEDSRLLDIALDLKKELIICTMRDNDDESGKCYILAFNLDGVLQHTHIPNNDILPDSIAIDSHGDLIVIDENSHSLVKLDIKGNFLSRLADIGVWGSICIDGDGNIIVSSTNDNHINIFNPDCSPRIKFGSSGSGKGELFFPQGIAADGEYILVSDSMNRRVQVFRYDGTFAYMIESEEDPLGWPRGLAVTKDGFVYVVDYDQHCIKMYKYKNMPWQQTQ